MIRRRRQTFAVLAIALTMLLAGCAGWGTDGPAEGADDPEPDETGDLEDVDNEAANEQQDTSEDERDADAAPGNDSADRETDTTDTDTDTGTDAPDANDESADEAEGDDTDDADDRAIDEGDQAETSPQDDGADETGEEGETSVNDTDGNQQDSGDGEHPPTNETGDEDGDADDEMYRFETTIQVVDGDGQPIEGESVRAWPAGAPDNVEEYVTDENGQVVLEGGSSDPSDTIMMIVEVAGEERTVHLDQDEHTETFTVEDGSETSGLTVHVIDGTGDEGALDAEVTITHIETGETATATTDDGAVRFDGLEPGEYRVDADAGEDWYVFEGVTDQSVDVPDNDEHTLELYPEPETHTLTVEVRDATTGDPIEGADVSGVGGVHPDGSDMMFSAETDSDGTATVETWESSYEVDVIADGYEFAGDTIGLDEDKQLTIELEPEEGGNGEENNEGQATPAIAA